MRQVLTDAWASGVDALASASDRVGRKTSRQRSRMHEHLAQFFRIRDEGRGHLKRLAQFLKRTTEHCQFSPAVPVRASYLPLRRCPRDRVKPRLRPINVRENRYKVRKGGLGRDELLRPGQFGNGTLASHSRSPISRRLRERAWARRRESHCQRSQWAWAPGVRGALWLQRPNCGSPLRPRCYALCRSSRLVQLCEFGDRAYSSHSRVSSQRRVARLRLEGSPRRSVLTWTGSTGAWLRSTALQQCRRRSRVVQAFQVQRWRVTRRSGWEWICQWSGSSWRAHQANSLVSRVVENWCTAGERCPIRKEKGQPLVLMA